MIGGGGRKALEEEKSRAGALNILIATPGRLLQHMDETPYFDCNALKILVLDEADRILDMGFRATLDAILENLPRGGRGGDGRQTLLFSATQTKSVKDLARLNLSDPEYISIHEEASMPTPVKLQQAFVECPSSQKISVLWGFIKTHLKAKVLVFFSTCKQSRFVSDAFSKLWPWESWTEGPQATTCVWIQRRSSTVLPGGGHDDPSPSLSSALAHLVLVLEGGGVPRGGARAAASAPGHTLCIVLQLAMTQVRVTVRLVDAVGVGAIDGDKARQCLPPRGPGDAIKSRWVSACSHGATGRPLASPALS